MIDTMGHRQVFDSEKFRYPVHVIGCGGMGSRVAEGLVRMGVGMDYSPIYLYDGDEYEEHNLANQYVNRVGIGHNKAYALRSQLLEIDSKLHIVTFGENITASISLSGVVFLCLDSMESRRVIMEKCLENNKNVPCVIETRMDASVGISHYFDPNNLNHQECWWLYWHSDDEAENIAGCGGPQSIISAIFGTTMLALKQLEHFARSNSSHGALNRVYQDFDLQITDAETWPT